MKKPTKKPKLLPALVLTGSILSSLAGAGGLEKKSVEQLKSKLIADGFEPDRIELIFSDPRINLDLGIRRIRRNARPVDYEKRGFTSERSINDGFSYFLEHLEPIYNAWKEYKVKPGYIIALMKMETDLGRVMGNRPVMTSLVTNWLIRDNSTDEGKKREKEEYENIRDYLRLIGKMYKDDSEIFDPEGSYAGASGLPQVMPSSYMRFAVDHDNDGDIDLMSRDEPADSIGFIAKYLVEKGYNKHENEDNNEDEYENIYKSVKSYNPNDPNFADAIMKYAEMFEKRFVVYVMECLDSLYFL